MIIKNGEILAIDHIAHDNTLSGNGTSAKPVGLSQSTKDLIDSKVKKTDFETYKSSVANQIRDINNTIAADESNFESYKETVAANFTAVDKRIIDVDAAKVNNTTFEQYQTDVTNNFTAVNKRIDDVSAAKVDNTTFDDFKGSVNGEIERIDGRIDTTNTNLTDNYYDKTTIDKKFADFGGYKFREPDPNNNNQPILNQGEDPDPKAIYLTQPEGATQYLQWIWDEEITEENKWKCIGDTTMDLSDYAKTVDVVASANNNVNAVKNWANDNFETISDFNTVIAGYYTKGEVNTELATKVDNDDFNAYKTEVNGKFATKQDLTNTKAELEDTIESVSGEIISKVNTDYRTLDGEIDAIATTLSNDYYTSQEIDAILAASGEYYTKTESDTKYAEKSVFETAINELSSNKLDKSATANWDVTEYTEGENIKIVGHEISSKDWSNEIADAVENKVDESELENYVTKTDFNKLDNEVGAIDDDLDILSGKTVSVIKDSETVKAIRSTEPDGTISYTLSAHDGKQADYLWKPTVNAAGDISWELALTGDTPATANIKGSNGDNGKTPELTSENYHIKWKYTDESIWNDLGDFRGASGADGKDGITPTITIDPNDDTWIINGIDTGIVASGAVGPAGKDGIDGKDGVDGKDGQNGISLSATSQELTNKTQVQIGQVNGPVQTTFDLPWGQDGISPTVTTNTLSPDEHQAEGHINGGVKVTITDKTGDHEYTAWNGNNGTMAGAPTIMGYDGIVANLNGTQYEVGLSSEYKGAIESISADYLTKTDAQNTYLTKADAQTNYQPKGNYANTADLQYVSAGVDYVSGAIPDTSDMATKTWVGQQGFLKNTDLTDYATKSYANNASANALSQAESWVETEGYLKSVSVATNGSIEGTGTTNNPLSLKTSAENALNIAHQLTPPENTQAVKQWIWQNTTPSHPTTPSGWVDATDVMTDVVMNWMNSYLDDWISNGIGLSAGWVGEEGFEKYTFGVDTTDMSANKQYAFTTTGWEEVVVPSVPDITATNGISANGHNIGLTTDVYSAIQEISAANDLVGANGISVVAGANNQVIIAPSGISPDKQYAMTTTGWAEVQAGTTFTGVTTTGSISGGGVNNDKIGLLTSAENALAAVNGKLNTSDVLTAADNILTGIKIGNTNYTIPDDYAKQTGNYQNLSAGSATSAYSAYSASYATTAASAYIDSNTTSAMSDIVDELHGKLDSTAAATTYLPLTGGSVKGVIELSGTEFDNAKLHFVRNSVSNTVDVGIGSNGEAVLKSAVPNNGYAQLMLSKNTNTNYPDIKIQIDNAAGGHKVMSVPESEYNNMDVSGNQNLVSGPNYTLAKTANGFTIGAALVNCTDINSVTLAPNTYYFVYEV